jgi:hypothetical protein
MAFLLAPLDEFSQAFSNCTQGFMYSLFFFHELFSPFVQRSETKRRNDFQHLCTLNSYMRTIPWFSSGSFMENCVWVLRPIMPSDKNRQDNVRYGIYVPTLSRLCLLLRFVSHKDLDPTFT